MELNKKTIVSVSKLYPTESLASIMPQKIEQYKAIINGNGTQTEIFAFSYKNHYYIAKGHCQFLAAAQGGAKEVAIHLLERSTFRFFSKSENLESTLSSIGKSTLYDFEAIGGFTYDDYPIEFENKPLK